MVENLPGALFVELVGFPNRRQAQICADVRGYAGCSEIRRPDVHSIRWSYRTLTLSHASCSST